MNDRLMSVSLPGSAWLMILSNHIDGIIGLLEAGLDDEQERARLARQLLFLLEAASAAPGSFDEFVTVQRETVDATLERLEYTPTADDRKLVERCVARTEDIEDAIRALAMACGFNA